MNLYKQRKASPCSKVFTVKRDRRGQVKGRGERQLASSGDLGNHSSRPKTFLSESQNPRAANYLRVILSNPLHYCNRLLFLNHPDRCLPRLFLKTSNEEDSTSGHFTNSTD